MTYETFICAAGVLVFFIITMKTGNPLDLYCMCFCALATGWFFGA